jgi:uncharacterized protein
MASRRLEMRGRPLVSGRAAGMALVLDRGLSFAMAVDVETGHIIDVHSGHTGESLVGRVLVMPGGRGSSSASTSLAEAVRLGTAPAAMVLGEVDEILLIGAIVARRLYGRTCPIVVLGATDREQIATEDRVMIAKDGTVTLL